jgi:hypothetical protein
MKTYCPMFWSQDQGIDYSAPILHLKDIVPSVGKRTFAFFDSHDRLDVGEILLLIWCPPVSDLNGWSEQPSEIAQSHLLKAKVVGAAQAPEQSAERLHNVHHGKLKYPLDILSCERFLPALQAVQEDSTSWYLQETGTANGNFLAWDELHWCGSAVVEGLTYLTASTSSETYMELILKVADDEIIGLFSLHMNPGGDSYDFGRKRLTGEERRAVKHALNIAQPLHDTQAAYLAE